MKSFARHSFLLLVIFTAAAAGSFAADNPVILEQVEYDVDGNTSVRALRRLSYIDEGQEFASLDAMIEALELERQDLTNTRNFSSVSYEYRESGAGRYTATFRIVDAWTIVPIPYPKYDSNTGLRLGLQTFWDNFFGTMTDAYLGMNLDIRPKDGGGSEIGQWSINPRISGLRLTDSMTFSTGMSQRYVEEEFVDDVTPSNSYDFAYYQSSFSGGTSFGIARNLSYTVSLGMDFRYGYSGDLGPRNEQPAAVTISHGIGWGKVDWLENRRKGYSLSLGNPHRIGTGKDFFYNSSFNFSGSAYLPFWKRFYYYPRLYTFYQFGDTSTFGGQLRGVADNAVSGVTGVVLNNSLAFQFWRFEGVWDAQVHPFLDIGLAYNGEAFDKERDFNVGAGIDLVLYIDKIPNLVARGTVGFDMRRFSMDALTQSMEIIISSNLHY